MRALAGRVPRMYLEAFLWWLSGGVSMVWGVVFWMVAARTIEAGEMGPGAASISAVALLSAVSNLGLGLGFVRFLPEAGRDGPRLLNAVLITGAATGALTSSLLVAVLWVGDLSLDVITAHPLRAAFYIAFVAIDTVLILQQYALMALGHMRLTFIQSIVVNVIRIAAVGLIGTLQNAFGIVIAWGVGEAAGMVIGLLWLLPLAYPGYRFRLALRLPARAVARYSLGNQAAQLLTVAPAALLPWLVIHQTGDDAAGAYAYVALSIAAAVMNVSISLGLAVLAEGARNEDHVRLHSRRALAVSLAVSAIAVVALVGGAPIALGLFGADYGANGTALLRWLLLGALIAAPTHVLIGELRVRKETGKVLALAVAVNAPMVVLAAGLLPGHGLLAIAVAWLVGHGIGALATAGYFLWRTTPLPLASHRSAGT